MGRSRGPTGGFQGPADGGPIEQSMHNHWHEKLRQLSLHQEPGIRKRRMNVVGPEGHEMPCVQFNPPLSAEELRRDNVGAFHRGIVHHH